MIVVLRNTRLRDGSDAQHTTPARKLPTSRGRDRQIPDRRRRIRAPRGPRSVFAVSAVVVTLARLRDDLAVPRAERPAPLAGDVQVNRVLLNRGGLDEFDR